MNRREMLAGVIVLPFAPSMLLKEPTAFAPSMLLKEPTAFPNVQMTIFEGKRAIPMKITGCPKKWPGEVRAVTTVPGVFDRMELVIAGPVGVKCIKNLPPARIRKGDTLNIAWKIVVVVT